MSSYTRRLYSFPLFTFLAMAGCSGDDGPSDPGNGNGNGTADVTVQVVNTSFNPSLTTVPANSTVVWQWNSAGVEHNVTFADGSASGNQSSGTFQRTFPATGEYDYACTIHAAQGMVGTVNVTAGAGGGGGSGGGGGGGGGDYP